MSQGPSWSLLRLFSDYEWRARLKPAHAAPGTSANAVLSRSGRDLRLQRYGSGDIGLRFADHGLVLPGKAAAIERPGPLGLQVQCSVVICDRSVVVLLPQVHQSAAVEERGGVGSHAQGGVAVCKS